MKSSNLLLIGAIVVAAAVLVSTAEAAPEPKKCQKPCERHCDPVCATDTNGVKKEFSNMCLYENHACEHPEDFVSVEKGRCVPVSTTTGSTTTVASTTTGSTTTVASTTTGS